MLSMQDIRNEMEVYLIGSADLGLTDLEVDGQRELLEHFIDQLENRAEEQE